MSSELKNLFLRQSYLDSYSEYERSLNDDDYKIWDYIILTASNETQAEEFRSQIDYRLQSNKLPKRTHYAVLPDPDGKRVGSGGATLNVMRYIAQRECSEDFSGLKILVIHSGGDSKRVPQYSACGKLFSPVPRALKDGRCSYIFDEFIIGMTGVPSRINDGMLVCSGDILLLFNPLQIDFYSKGAAALSIKEDVETGKNHGVFVGDEDGNVGKFLHKQSVENLRKNGAVNENNKVNIDTGAVIFDSNILNDLYTMADTDEKFNSLVNEHVRLSFYADFLYPLASHSTLEQFYLETPEGDFSDELKNARTDIWERLHKYKMKLVKFSPASFIHFGTTHELLSLVSEKIDTYSSLDWSAQVNTNVNEKVNYSVNNSIISPNAVIGDNSYIEDSMIKDGVVIGKGCVVSSLTLENITIPDNTVVHGLKLSDGKFVVRKYGVNDNPKEAKLFGNPIATDLWTAPLYPVCNTIYDALHKCVNDEKSDRMISLKDSFNQADVLAILPWRNNLNDNIKTELFINAIKRNEPVDEVTKLFNHGVCQNVKQRLLDYADSLSNSDLNEFSIKIRIYYYLSMLIDKRSMQNKCFGTICDALLNASLENVGYNPDFKIKKDKAVVSLPVRVNWGGGWSDTPPYCMEHGGNVINASITLNGEYPIEVTIKRVEGNKIILASTDIGSYKEFTDISELQNCRDTGDAFALHKAALIACGVIPYKEEISVKEITDNLGGGFYLNTRVINIPKGSGLGTSSILAGACVKSIYNFMGVDIADDELFKRILCMEQIMSTGGGWQDQAGGIINGFKLITSEPGLNQNLICTPVRISQETLEKLNKKFAIIYTGQRRLARNLLREIVGKYIGNDPEIVKALYETQRIAVLMRFELEKGSIKDFASLMNETWALNQRLDAGCTNTCINQIFNDIDDMIDGKMICGAGGGGFLQVILKDGFTIDMLRKRLDDIYSDSGVMVWECQFC